MSVLNDLNRLSNCRYSVSNYNENKSAVFNFLHKIKGNADIKASELKKILTVIDPILEKLSDNQVQIKNEKLKGKLTFSLIYQFKIAVHFFKKLFFGDHRLHHLQAMRNEIAKESKLTNFKKTTALNKFRTIVKKLQKNIACGVLVPNSMLLDKNYWMETLGMELIIGKERIRGHLYTGYLTSGENYLKKWQTEKDERGVSYHEQYSFQDYLNAIVIPRLNPDELKAFREKISVVEYYTPAELASLEAQFDQSGNICTRSPILNAWVEQQAKQGQSPQVFSDFYATCSSVVESKELERLTNQTYMYILDHTGRLFVQIKNRGKTNHTSLSNGKAILAAGSFKVKEGRITEIDTFSGHYKPTKVQLVTLLECLKKAQVDINAIKLTYVDNYQVQPWIIKEVMPGQVEQWLEQHSSLT
ncbi:hypothetical protein [Candidatus Protochlamydia phocaeensis]|uniref:hypothetical protein n=1 Tax=Candidatus Protochlamydia phocaeensis TaxID=1414722 RepID=UPI00083862ED|nr:hypothetical protein [Candidatus Protochlamydia phocaeensis]